MGKSLLKVVPLVALLLSAGCTEATGPGGPAGMTPLPAAPATMPPESPSLPPEPQPLPPGTIRAEDATGYWNQTQVEAWLRESLKTVELTLVPAGGHNYTGSATTLEGKVYQLDVRQVPGGIACTFGDGAGSSGRIAFGNTVPGG